MENRLRSEQQQPPIIFPKRGLKPVQIMCLILAILGTFLVATALQGITLSVNTEGNILSVGFSLPNFAKYTAIHWILQFCWWISTIILALLLLDDE